MLVKINNLYLVFPYHTFFRGVSSVSSKEYFVKKVFSSKIVIRQNNNRQKNKSSKTNRTHG